jgi:hypothetical protein
VVLSFVYCAVSWTFVETRFLRLKEATDHRRADLVAPRKIVTS